MCVDETLPVLCKLIECAWFSRVQRILADKEKLPAGLVRPTEGTLTWILDTAAAEHVKE